MLKASVFVDASIKKLNANPGAIKPNNTPEITPFDQIFIRVTKKIKNMMIVPIAICKGTIIKGENPIVTIFVTTIAPVHNIIEVICEICPNRQFFFNEKINLN